MQMQTMREVHALHEVHQMTARTPFLLGGDVWGSVLFHNVKHLMRCMLCNQASCTEGPGGSTYYEARVLGGTHPKYIVLRGADQT